MKQEVSYTKASTYYLVGNLFNKGMSFLTVPIFTRILSISDYGIVTTYTSWVSILSMMLGFALHMGIRAAFIDYKEKINDFMSVTVFFTITSSFAIGILFIAAIWFLKTNLSLFLIVLCLFQGFSESLIQDYLMYLMMQYRYKFRTTLMILPNVISLIISIWVILFVLRGDRYLGRIVPTALVSIFFGLFIIILVFRKSHMIFNKTYLKYGLAISTPLIIHGIALNILSQSDRTMITWLANASQTGIYSLVYNFSMIATVITTSLDGIWVPWFTERMKVRSIDSINKLAVGYVDLMTYIIVCLLLVGPEILKILASKPYWEGINIIPPVVLANYFIFMYTLYVNIEHFYKKTLYITINTIVAAVANIVLNYLLIPRYGYVAAAYSTTFSYLLSLVLHAWYSKKLESDVYPLKMFIWPLVHIFVTTIVFYVLINLPVVRWLLMLFYFIAMIVHERKRIFEFFPEIKQRFNLKY